MKPHIAEFFKFLQKKDNKDIPLEIKFSNPKDFKLTPKDLDIKRDLELSRLKVEYLPNNLHVRGNLSLQSTPLSELPAGLRVEGDLDICYSKVYTLPDDLKVEGTLYFYGTPLWHSFFKSSSSTDDSLDYMSQLDFMNMNLEIKKYLKKNNGYIKGGATDLPF